MDFGMQNNLGACSSVTSLSPFMGAGTGMTLPGMGAGYGMGMGSAMSPAAMRCCQGSNPMMGSMGTLDSMSQLLQMEQQLLMGMMQLLLGLMMGRLMGTMANAAAGLGATDAIGSDGTGSTSSGSGTGSASGSSGTSSADTPDVSSQGDVPVPNGRSGIEKVFGAPGSNIVSVKMPAGPDGKEIEVHCNAKIAPKLKAAFEEIKSKGLSHLIHSFDGSYCYRNKRGGSELSVHSWGIAFDVNASENPMGRSHGTAGQQQLAEIFAKYGFHQLGNDRMHFQYCTGY